jgi:hypothetical protein
MLTLLAATALVALAAASADASRAERMVYLSITGQELLDVMQSEGYVAQLREDDLGNPQIRSAVGGIDFTVLFYDCSPSGERQCKSFDLVAGFDLSKGIALDSINQWNSSKRYGAAYVDDENDPWINMFINLDGGLTGASILDSLAIWSQLMDDFKAHIRF